MSNLECSWCGAPSAQPPLKIIVTGHCECFRMQTTLDLPSLCGSCSVRAWACARSIAAVPLQFEIPGDDWHVGIEARG